MTSIEDQARGEALDRLVRDYKDPQLIGVVCRLGCPAHGLICAWRLGDHTDPLVHRCIVTNPPHEWSQT